MIRLIDRLTIKQGKQNFGFMDEFRLDDKQILIHNDQIGSFADFQRTSLGFMMLNEGTIYGVGIQHGAETCTLQRQPCLRFRVAGLTAPDRNFNGVEWAEAAD